MDLHPPYLDQNPQHRIDIRETVAMLIAHFNIRPIDFVVDFGCNTGDWIRGFIENGHYRCSGLDQEHMRPHLLIPPAHFIVADIVHSQFDPIVPVKLAICMEVAEHVPAEDADLLLMNLTQDTDTVLFSAATPGQGGHGHINEQPHSYWAAKFKELGFSWDESIREKLPAQLVWWYRRNMAVCRRVV